MLLRNSTQKNSLLLSELEDCNDNEQKQKIIEMNELMDEMERKKFCRNVDFEKEKKEEKNEKLLADLCKCYTMLSNHNLRKELLSICLSSLLKAALNKDDSEETRKEVEIALLALSKIEGYHKIEKKPYLEEMKEMV
ncbi:uncharacterized protein MONOS_15413 [Monocercomonoides exilis]|uniref:uncharacterized protein n=1 Tax=Monocercomonoides exilis TaxID=2049356 RepID=UPI00355977BB|nr:hypothetical protein MONOS_15413 [Monocercomonoides exilis]|eukprot:MONOS_15413.1-p1 / transcript=MONOS_15413.1 / gene=MONOS_15413 / organism=Monocercomonoides_exilis_PA203 / gene_product=unspecified product / transcript_product=unspecified product / location=Mono_scaffold01224:13160-13921(+) / protein_length=137 / sequence_SO=supercontig / SO=protein_coding / is_pseudo=false